MEEPKHKRLSLALCEAVEFGRPTKIRLGHEDFSALLASINKAWGAVDMEAGTFEGVPYTIEHGLNGCLVEHDARYTDMAPLYPTKAIPDTVAMDRTTRKPVIVAW